MKEILGLKCKQCGGALSGSRCPWCGTEYRIEAEHSLELQEIGKAETREM